MPANLLLSQQGITAGVHVRENPQKATQSYLILERSFGVDLKSKEQAKELISRVLTAQVRIITLVTTSSSTDRATGNNNDDLKDTSCYC